MNKIEEQMKKASKTLATMLDYLGLDATLKAEEKGSRIALIVSSDDAGRIIGRKGQALENLQLLINRMMLKADEECPKIIIDIDGYSRKERDGQRERPEGKHPRGDEEDHGADHEKVLTQQALDAAKDVKRWGDPVTLPPMNAHDRRIIHITLQEESELQTESVGDGTRKSVVISLKK